MDAIIELFERHLSYEKDAKNLLKLPPDTYSKLALYLQDLRRIGSTNGVELTSRLIKRQEEILLSLATQLLDTRLEKVVRGYPASELLPEERYLALSSMEYRKNHHRFVKALANGQPSFFNAAQKAVMSRKVTVRFLRPVGEMMGFDLKRYGPFEVHDLAIIPAGNAEVLLSSGEAVLVESSSAQ